MSQPRGPMCPTRTLAPRSVLASPLRPSGRPRPTHRGSIASATFSPSPSHQRGSFLVCWRASPTSTARPHAGAPSSAGSCPTASARRPLRPRSHGAASCNHRKSLAGQPPNAAFGTAPAHPSRRLAAPSAPKRPHRAPARTTLATSPCVAPAVCAVASRRSSRSRRCCSRWKGRCIRTLRRRRSRFRSRRQLAPPPWRSQR
mmetsp:Transcript_97882/g.281609  ORF Transcript_97882/g.281609 Transcript_97882/m.281609 type:complete len:201 (-) Transcript_97882:318-920(-)